MHLNGHILTATLLICNKENMSVMVCATLGYWQGKVSSKASFIKYNVSITKLAHCLAANIDIVRTRVRGSTDVDGFPVTNIAINVWFMIHHLQEVQGLEH